MGGHFAGLRYLVPGFGMAPQTRFSVVSLSMRPWNSVRVATILNNFVGVAFQ